MTEYEIIEVLFIYLFLSYVSALFLQLCAHILNTQSRDSGLGAQTLL